MIGRSKSSVSSGLQTSFGMAILAVGFLATLGTVLAFFGGAWWAFDVIANFRLQLALVLLVCGLLYGALFGRGGAVLFIGAAVLNAALVVPMWLSSQPAVASDQRLQIITLDVTTSLGTRSPVIGWISTVDADLIFLQQTTPAWIESIREADTGYTVIAEPAQSGQSGTIALAKVPYETRVYPVLPGTEPIVEVSADLAGRPVTVLSMRADTPSGENDAQLRDELFQAAGELVASRNEPVIVVGDLNVTRWSHAFRTLTGAGSLNNSEDGFGYQATWPANDWPLAGDYAGLPLDHALTTTALTTAGRSIGPAVGSDHLPLIVDIAPAAG